MQRHLVHILAPFACIALLSSALADGDIRITAQESRASISPRSPHHRLIKLPELEFTVEMAWQCGEAVRSVTLSVADTLHRLGDELLEGDQPVSTTITVPARQVKLVAHPTFCIDGEAHSGGDIRIPGMATANASLRCESETGTSVWYASAPLPVTLSCDIEAEPAQEVPTDR